MHACMQLLKPEVDGRCKNTVNQAAGHAGSSYQSNPAIHLESTIIIDQRAGLGARPWLALCPIIGGARRAAMAGWNSEAVERERERWAMGARRTTMRTRASGGTTCQRRERRVGLIFFSAQVCVRGGLTGVVEAASVSSLSLCSRFFFLLFSGASGNLSLDSSPLDGTNRPRALGPERESIHACACTYIRRIYIHSSVAILTCLLARYRIQALIE